MKLFLLSALALMLLSISAPAQGPVLFKRDSGTPKGHDTTAIDGWEETVIFNPGGPCALKQIYIYYDGTRAADDTLWIVGDPSEGALPPTSAVWSYNSLTDPIVTHYSGTPGWDTIDVSDRKLQYDGYDRIAIQHRVHDDGPWFATDNNGVASPLSSFLYDPFHYPDGFPVIGKYFAARGDFMVRLLLQFDFPSGNGSAKPPAATLVECASAVGVVDTAGKPLKSARVSVADWNGDGWDDIAVGSSFFQNNGDGTFRNISATIGIQAGASVWGDYDNDGKLDCYAINGGAGDRLYHNNGNSTFTDVTAASGLSNPYPTVTPIWFDFNQDGKLDLFISNGRTEDASGEAYFPDQIWQGKGDGTFINVTDSTGISPQEMAASPDGAQYSDCWGASVADYNQDGWPDIHVATYRLAADLLFRNNQNGTFTDVGEKTGVRGVATEDPTYFGHGLGTEWGDYDNDGDMDLMVGNLGHPDSRGAVSNPSLLFRNNGAPNYDFAEVHKRAGIKFFEMNAGVVWLDLDLDGFLDLFHCQYSYSAQGTNGEPRRLSRMYLNEGPATNYHMKDITWSTGPLVHGAWTAVRTDFDNDGDMDLIVASPTDALKVFRNDIPRRGNYAEFRLVGNPDANIPMDGFGTKITLYAGGKKFFRELQGGGGGVTGSQNSNVLHFGLGTADQFNIEVKYTNGSLRTYYGLHANQRFTFPYDGPYYVTSGVKTETGEAAEKLALTNTGFSDGSFFCYLSGADQRLDTRIDVVNSIGRRVASTRLDAGTSGLRTIRPSGALPSGVYFIRATSGSRSTVAGVRVIR